MAIVGSKGWGKAKPSAALPSDLSSALRRPPEECTPPGGNTPANTLYNKTLASPLEEELAGNKTPGADLLEGGQAVWR